MPVYPGDPSPSFKSYATLEKEGVNITKIVMGSHTGTHLDAPRHFIQGGTGIDQIPVDRLIGEAYVVDLSRTPIGSGIMSRDLLPKLEQKIQQDDIVVCYTGCSERWGDDSIKHNYTYLTQDAAEYLVSKKVRAVGIDFLSIEKFNAGIFIIESLSNALKQFLGKRILMVCLPIKLEAGDGAPARVVAVPIG